jgi:O-antigen ligase
MRAIHTILGTGTMSERDQSSDLYRLVETYNIWSTIRAMPLTGIGFGRPFIQFVPMLTLAHWEFQFYTPHNEVLWIWLKMGIPGFVVTFWLFALAVARTARLLVDRAADSLLPFIVTLVSYYVMLPAFAYVDIGFANGRTMLWLGVALGITGLLPGLLQREAGAAPARAAARPDSAARPRRLAVQGGEPR